MHGLGAAHGCWDVAGIACGAAAQGDHESWEGARLFPSCCPTALCSPAPSSPCIYFINPCR